MDFSKGLLYFSVWGPARGLASDLCLDAMRAFSGARALQFDSKGVEAKVFERLGAWVSHSIMP